MTLFRSFLYAGGPGCFIFAIFCFAPYIFYSHEWQVPTVNDPISHGLKSLSFQYSLVATIAASTPPLIEITADIIFSRGNLNARTLIIFSVLFCLVFPELIALSFITSQSNAKLYLCNHHASLIVYMFSGCMILCQCSQKFWRTRLCSLATTSIYFGFAVLILPPYFDTTLKLFFQCFGISLQFIGCLIFLFLSYKFLNTKLPDDRNNVQVIADDLICRFTTIFTDFVIVGKFILFFASGLPYWTELTGVYLSLETLIVSAPIIGICFAFSRATKNEAYFMQNVRQKFVRYISHEMRTPLNAAVMGLQFLRSELAKSRTDTELLEIVDEVRGACEISVSILNEMLDYDKLESGLMKLEKEEVYVKTFLETTISTFFVQANHKGIDLKFEVDDASLNSLQIEVDTNKFAQVIRNLISNGIKFTPTGGTVKVVATILENQPSVAVAVADPKGIAWLRIDVIDSGVGVSKENQKKLFKEMVQFNPGKLQNGGGSGLGLYISKGIMDLHQGDLTVASEGEGFGCTFTVTLPIKGQTGIAPSDASEFKDSNSNHSRTSRLVGWPSIRGLSGRSTSFSSLKIAPKDITSDANQSAIQYLQRSWDECRNYSEEELYSNVDELPPTTGPPPLSSSSLRILVVDDSTSNRKMLVRLLKDRCRDITEAEDGLDAVRKIRDAMTTAGSKGNTPTSPPTTTTSPVSEPHTPYDVVLMDFIMPNMEGPEAARCMREGGYCGLIIGITGNMLPVDRERYLREGANMVLTKPVNIQDIDKALQLVETNRRCRFTPEPGDVNTWFHHFSAS